jgi:hypothetical protein
MQGQKNGSEQASAKFYLFQSRGTDLYALSLRDHGEDIPRVNGCPPWCLREEISNSSLVAGADAAELARVMVEVRRHGFFLFRGEEAPVH